MSPLFPLCPLLFLLYPLSHHAKYQKIELTISQRLFSPYVQTEIGRRQGGKGSGLGLALVRQIVRLSNGRLGVDSEYGKGSIFWFELPYAIPIPKSNKPSTKSKIPGSPHPGRPPMLQGVSTIDEESMSGSMVMNSPSPAMERDDPLDRIECRSSEVMPLTPFPPTGGALMGGHGNSGGEGHGIEHGHGHGPERPKMQETESTMPLLSRTPSGRIRRESGMSSDFISPLYSIIPHTGPDCHFHDRPPCFIAWPVCRLHSNDLTKPDPISSEYKQS